METEKLSILEKEQYMGLNNTIISALLFVVGNVMDGAQPKTVIPVEVVNFETPEEEQQRLEAEENDVMSPDERRYYASINRHLKSKLRTDEKDKAGFIFI